MSEHQEQQLPVPNDNPLIHDLVAADKKRAAEE